MLKGDWTQRQQFWIVAKRDHESSADLLHVNPDGNEETLAVFSHQREAEAFLSLVMPPHRTAFISLVECLFVELLYSTMKYAQVR
jgi:hypothetical protein